MIARLWHGVTESSKSEEYLHYLSKTGVKDYQATPGIRGVYVLRRTEDQKAHFLILTFWESKDAIADFAGPDIDQARYYAADKEYLLELEETVTHYEVLVDSQPSEEI
ncbi:MAG TPA: hypothetical protein VN643_26740 [Pyrinomonadaceae bacterium]|nr:hypothetical protein [Pyrinomonadaceae bacterium]